MNKIIVLFVILILGSALTAQTDQLSINFGLSKEEVHSILTDKGFSVSEVSNTSCNTRKLSQNGTKRSRSVYPERIS
jgi:hypothetical protein